MITGSLHLRQDAVVDAQIVVGAARGAHQRAARHQDDAAAQRLDRLDLLLIGADHVVDRDAGVGGEMVGAGAARDQRAGPVLGRVERAPDQLKRGRPVDAHAALRGVHRLGDAEPEVPDVVAEGDGLVPVDRGIEPGIVVGERIGGDVHRRIGDAAKRWRIAPLPRGTGKRRVLDGVVLERPSGSGSLMVVMASASSCAARLACRAGTSTQRRSVQLFIAELGELHALGALDQVELPRRVGDDVADELLPLQLEAVLVDLVVRHLVPLLRRTSWSAARPDSRPGAACSRDAGEAARQPATAEPWVPSTWKVTRSSRFTRTHQDELMCAMAPPASWKVA